MSDEARETLSALVDGELADDTARRAVDDVLGDASLTRRWACYHLIGSALRGELDSGAPAELAERVRAQVGAEVTVLAPRPRSLARARLRPVAGFAIAASVAAMATAGVLIWYEHEPGRAPSLAAVPPPAASPTESSVTPAGTPGATGRDTYVAVAASATEQKRLRLTGGPSGEARPARTTPVRWTLPDYTGMRWSSSRPADEARLNAYLVNHAEYQGNGMRGLLPYARIVGYDPRR